MNARDNLSKLYSKNNKRTIAYKVNREGKRKCKLYFIMLYHNFGLHTHCHAPDS